MKLDRKLILRDGVALCAGMAFFASAFTFEHPAGLETFAALVFSVQLIMLIHRNAESRLIMLFLLFCLAYPMTFLLSKHLDVPYHYILEYQDPKLELILWANGIVFFSVFFFSIKSTKSQLLMQLQATDRSLYWAALTTSIGLILLAVINAWPPIISGYSVESRSSSLFEYSIIPAVIAALVAKSKKEKQFIYLLILIGILSPLLFMRRGVSIIFFTLMFYQATRSVKNPAIIIVALSGAFLAFRSIALIRSGLEISFASILGLHLNEAMSNHHGGAIVSSVTYLGLIDGEVWDFVFRFRSALGLSFTPFVPFSLNPFPQVFLHLEALKVANIPGSGGFPFVFLYVWGGIVFVLLGAAAMRWVMFNTYRNPALISIKLIMLVSFPRWYAYSLPIGFKYVVITFVIAAILMSCRKKSERHV